MNKKLASFIVLILVMLVIPLTSAVCSLTPILVNQDPYPAQPGEIVKVVFQLDGISDPSCGLVTFEVEEEYPFTIDPSSEKKISVRSGTYTEDFKPFLLAPYNIRIDKNAIEGETPITVLYSGVGAPIESIEKNFNIFIEDSQTDFEISIKKYTYDTKKIVFEVLNIGESDVEALTLEIPSQENIAIIGTNRVIVGNLESNEEEIADFEAEIKEGEITVKIIYTDQIGVRRSLEKTVMFSSDNFKREAENKNLFSSSNSFLIGIAIPIIIFFIYRYYKKKKEHKRRHHLHRHHR